MGIAAVSGFVGGVVAASPLGLTGQAVAGAYLGGGTYIAEQLAKNESIDPIDLAVSTVTGAASGIIGGSGADEGMYLTRTLTTYKLNIAKSYSMRASRALHYRVIQRGEVFKTVIKVIGVSSARFAAGSAVSTYFGNNKNHIIHGMLNIMIPV